MSSSSFKHAAPVNGLLVRQPGKTKSDCFFSACALSNLTVASDSGIDAHARLHALCGHNPQRRLKSISSHWALTASDTRTAVRITNSSALGAVPSRARSSRTELGGRCSASRPQDPTFTAVSRGACSTRRCRPSRRTTTCAGSMPCTRRFPRTSGARETAKQIGLTIPRRWSAGDEF